MKTRLLVIILVSSIIFISTCAFSESYHRPLDNEEFAITSSGGFGNGGFGGYTFGGGFSTKTATPKPTATPTPKPLTEDIYAINQLAKSVYMLQVYDANHNYLATGSGFLAFNNYTLVTNYHVIDQAAYIKAYSDEGFEYELDSVLATDKDKDIAILTFRSPVAVAPLVIDKNITAIRGEKVLTIGSPIGIRNTISTGNITNVIIRDSLQYYQFSAPISSGNSGGVLLNDSGYVLGVTTSTRISDENVIQNINYAVPISYVIDLYNNPKSIPIPIQDFFSKRKVSDDISINVLPDCTVQFSWDSSLFDNNSNYHVIINEKDGLYTFETDLNETYFEWCAVPDYTYKISVATSPEDTHSSIFTVKANLYPIKRFFANDGLDLVIEIDEKKYFLDSFSKTDLINILTGEHKESIRLNRYLGTSSVETDNYYTFVIKSPSASFCKITISFTVYAFDKSSWRTEFVDVDPLFSKMFSISNYESGDYIVQLYIDGYLVDQTHFTLQ